MKEIEKIIATWNDPQCIDTQGKSILPLMDNFVILIWEWLNIQNWRNDELYFERYFKPILKAKHPNIQTK
jgi:hypothetical protein